ncbi:MAG: hypothetical protein RBR09_08020 [Desulfobulbaceae bacterium]|jgi:hypothetical protein|nr:hypothetical protein [Desulfobulbaceae bacterium]MDY0351184.1 hypothetical protein [Desulfobulbaceae bacterium]
MKNLFAMLAIAAIMTLPAGPMLDAGKAADAGTIIAKKGDPSGPGGWKDAPKPPGWSKSKKTSKLEVLPGSVIMSKGSGDNRPSPPGWSGKKGK